MILGRSPMSLARTAVEALGVSVFHNLIQPFRRRPPRPRAMDYLSTHRCNARCVMCGIWKEHTTATDDLSPAQLATILRDPLFSRLQFVGMSGGEPFLRNDLLELIRVILEKRPRLKRFSLTTNGLLHRRIADTLPRIVDLSEETGVLLDVSLSVHGLDATQDAVYGVPGAFDRLQRSLEVVHRLHEHGRLSYSFNSVLLASNLNRAEELLEWGSERGIPVNFVVGEQRERFRTNGMEDAFIGDDDWQQMTDFFRRLATRQDVSAATAIKYRELADVLDGRCHRSLSCHYAMGGLLLGHDGSIYYCPHSRSIGNCRDGSAHAHYYDPANLSYRDSEIIGGRCRTCPPYTRTRREIEKDLGRTLIEVAARRLGVRTRT